MAQITETQYLTTVQNDVTKELQVHSDALPKGFNSDRFILNAMAVVKDNIKNFNNIAADSVATALAKGAYLGLDFFNKECYAIPYGGTVQFQTDYKGEIKLCKKYSRNPIKDIYAKLVREGDFFEEVIEDGRQTIRFKPVPFSNAPIIGAFAVVYFRDDSMLYETMSTEEIENTRKAYAKKNDSKAWTVSTGEMYKKTVLRRLCKLIDLDFDNIEQVRAFDEGSGMEFDNNKRDIIDVEEAVDEDPIINQEQKMYLAGRIQEIYGSDKVACNAALKMILDELGIKSTAAMRVSDIPVAETIIDNLREGREERMNVQD